MMKYKVKNTKRGQSMRNPVMLTLLNVNFAFVEEMFPEFVTESGVDGFVGFRDDVFEGFVGMELFVVGIVFSIVDAGDII